ncbi:uncharacterized protein LOC129911874 [Episyrphus balteatus]|uniref:uncharacterized protein LOC129911874 n=1 Tax=Episyrphus balteatus TaxID=286459 RepID=UPI00248541FC|nr:uncharacterized protein LOC129911874 [Episyrphus balteatus]
MRFQLVSVIALVAFVSSVYCGCDRSGEVKPSEDGDVTQFFKNLGCDIKKGADKVSESAKPYIDDLKKGAEKVSESAKPYIDEIGKSAKKFGGTVADRFNDLKEKINGNPENATIVPETSSNSSLFSSADVKAVDESSSLGRDLSSSTTQGPLSSSSILPDIDDRILLDIDEPKCPENTKNDGRGHCRTVGR